MDEIEIPLSINLPKIFKQIDQLSAYINRKLGNNGGGILGVPTGVGGGGGRSGGGGTYNVYNIYNFNGGGGGGGYNPGNSFLNQGLRALGLGRFTTVAGRALRAAGLTGAQAGVAGVGLMGLGALVAEAQKAAEALAQFSQATFVAGGNSLAAGAGIGVGRSLGLGAGGFGSAADAFAARISSDVLAMAFTGQRDLPGALGRLDRTSQLLQHLDRLRSLPEADAIRAARAAGTEQFLPLRNLSAGTYSAITRADPRIAASIYRPERIQAGAEFQAQLGRFTSAVEGFLTVFTGPTVDIAARTMKVLSDSIMGWTTVLNNPIVSGFLTPFGQLSNALKGLEAAFGGKSGQAPIDKNTEALDNLSAILLKGGPLGNGAQAAASAFPGAYGRASGHNVYDARNAINWGAFSL